MNDTRSSKWLYNPLILHIEPLKRRKQLAARSPQSAAHTPPHHHRSPPLPASRARKSSKMRGTYDTTGLCCISTIRPDTRLVCPTPGLPPQRPSSKYPLYVLVNAIDAVPTLIQRCRFDMHINPLMPGCAPIPPAPWSSNARPLIYLRT